MIIRLQGILFHKQPPYIGLDVKGVGYGLQGSLTTFASLPDCGHEVTLHTYLLVREDAQQLYGFVDANEREMFLILVKINGVGPKLALAILSTYDVSQLTAIILQADLASLTRISGIGKKTAERLLIELRDKVDQIAEVPKNVASEFVPTRLNVEQTIKTEAIAALQALGYKPNEAQRVIQQVYTPEMDVEAAIRAALRPAG